MNGPIRRVLWLVLGLAAGCGPAPGDDDTAGDDDDTAGDDDASDDDAGTSDTGGYVALDADLFYGAGDEPVRQFAIFAGFSTYTVIQEGTGSSREELDPLDGEDDCGLWRYEAGASSGAVVEYTYHSAGTIAVRGEGQEFLLDPIVETDGWVHYAAYPSDEGVEPVTGLPYSASAPGDDFPAFAADPGAALPDPLDLVAPDLRGWPSIPRGDVDLAWTGSGEEPLSLGLSVRTDDGDTLQVLCQPADDGAFTLPSGVVDPLPAYDMAYLYLVRQGSGTTVDLGGGIAVHVSASAGVSGYFALE
ncbi:hypothetical protein L6R50_13200 [Myxococcota bacterium]|nr:hypothetical protein [Myxococcota bacterium]